MEILILPVKNITEYGTTAQVIQLAFGLPELNFRIVYIIALIKYLHENS